MKRAIRALKKSGYSGEIFYVEKEITPVEFKSNRLYAVEDKVKSGYGVRVFKDGRMGFSSVFGDNLDRAVESAIESVKLGVETDFSLPSPARIKGSLKYYHEDTEKIKVKEMIKMGEELLNKLGVLGDVSIDISLRKSVKRVKILNTEGVELEYKKTGWSFGAVVFAIVADSVTWIYDFYSGSKFVDRRNQIERYIKDLYRKSKTLAKPIKGKKDVIFMPSALHTVLIPISRGVNGENVMKGTSPLAGKLGKKVLSDKISIIDNPFKSWGINTCPFDDEGVPTRKKYIFRKGILENYILDLRSAKKLGLNPTGNGFRYEVSLPSPDFTNMEIASGDTSIRDMISSMKDGLIVYSVLGAGQSNIIAGDFSVNASLAFRVKNGEMVGRVKDTMIAGNSYRVFKKVKEVSRERKNFEGMLLPAIKFSSINIYGDGG